MKKIMIVSLLLLFFGFVSGQNSSMNIEGLPVVVDNSEFFPPVGTQYFNSCHVYSMVYYLKSYIWNRKYNRDPKLLKNQFNPYFVWNLNIYPNDHGLGGASAFYPMKVQGCATLNDWPIQEDQEIMPSLDIRKTALAYKSKDFKVISMNVHTEAEGRKYLAALKDSLNKGVCFTIHFPVYKVFQEMYTGHDFIYNYENYARKDMIASHVVAVVGYNDTIMTKSGSRGALKIINSYGPLFGDKGYFYLDYKWFNMSDWSFYCYFLYEDFQQSSESCFSFKLEKTLTGEDIVNRNYLFVDQVFDYQGEKYDNVNAFICDGRPSIVRVKCINNQNINPNNEMVLLNNHNHDGNRQVIADMSDYVKASDFKSMNIIVNDPISATYVGEDNQVIYSYTREATATASEPKVTFLKNNSYILGKIIDLPDTTIVVNNFYSVSVGVHVTPQIWTAMYISSCTSVLKRKLVTFSIADLQEEKVAPVFVDAPQVLDVVVNKTLTYTFKAEDKYNRLITYALENSSSEASLTSNGQLTFKSARVGTSKFTVVASNSDTFATCAVSVKVAPYTDSAEELEAPEGSFKIFPNPLAQSATIEFLLPKEGMAKIEVFNSIGQSVSAVTNKIYQAGEQQIDYDASYLRTGVYIFRLSSASFSKSLKIVKQ